MPIGCLVTPRRLLRQQALQPRSDLVQLGIQVVAASIVELLAPPEGGVRVHCRCGGLGLFIMLKRIHDRIMLQHAVLPLPAVHHEHQHSKQAT